MDKLWNGRYRPIKELGDGTFGAVKICKQNQFNDRDGILFYALRELMILQHLQKCKHVVRLVDAFVSSEN